MIVEATVWVPDELGEDGNDNEGDVVIEAAGDEEIHVHVRVNGAAVAIVTFDRFKAGMVVGLLSHAASEAAVEPAEAP